MFVDMINWALRK